MTTRWIVSTFVLLCVAALPVRADWNEGDSHKMHYPQLPDPTGIDVSVRFPEVVADDWRCSETGPVTDVHFWFSALNDATPNIQSVHLSIHADIPASPTQPYSKPGALLWQRDFSPAQSNVTVRWAGAGDQGWYVPENGFYNPHDHLNYYQMNIVDILEPFYQQQGTLYWLDISIQAETALGWKTSRSPQFMDTAVWNILGGTTDWQPIYDPRFPGAAERLDLAFVITPEPGTLALLIPISALALRRR